MSLLSLLFLFCYSVHISFSPKVCIISFKFKTFTRTRTHRIVYVDIYIYVCAIDYNSDTASTWILDHQEEEEEKVTDGCWCVEYSCSLATLTIGWNWQYLYSHWLRWAATLLPVLALAPLSLTEFNTKPHGHRYASRHARMFLFHKATRLLTKWPCRWYSNELEQLVL